MERIWGRMKLSRQRLAAARAIIDRFSPDSVSLARWLARLGARVQIVDVVLQLSPLPTVGVTGSAGKSTATLLLHDMLTTAGRRVYMGRDSVMENLWPNYEVLEQLDELRPPGWLLLELTSSQTEPEAHPGEEALIVLEGRVNIRLPDSGGWFELNPRDGFYLPPGIRHQYCNLSDRPAVVVFGVAPKYRD